MDKERFDAFAELAKFRQGRMYDRTKREAQFSFAVWGFIAAAIAFPHPRPTDYLLVAPLTVIVFVHAWFVIEVWARNRLDGSMTHYYLGHAEHLVSTEAPKPSLRPDYDQHMSIVGRDWTVLISRDFWWSGTEIILTTALAVLAFLLIGTASMPTR